MTSWGWLLSVLRINVEGMRINWQIVGWSAGAVTFAALVATAAAIGPIWAPQAEAPATEDTGVYLVDPAEPVVETAPTPTPTVAPAPVAETTAPVPPPAPAAPSKAASGTPLPFYPSSDPQNADGGQYADPATYCASGSASTVNGVPTCD